MGPAGCARQRRRDVRTTVHDLFRLIQPVWDRFHDARWQETVRRGLVPVTIGLVIASGTVMARAADVDWQAAAVTIAAATLMLSTRLNPLWMLLAGGTLGRLGLL